MSDMVEVVLSTALAQLVGAHRKLQVRPGTCDEVLGQVCEQYPRLRPRLVDRNGNILPFVNVYLDDDNVRELGGLTATVKPATTVLIMTAVAGG